MTDTMIKVAMFLGDNGEAELSRLLFAEQEAAIKQARAEVLAGCISGARVYFDDFRDVPPPPITIEEVIRFLRGVQPAASDLEALLLQARNTGFIEGSAKARAIEEKQQ